jgi:hypothetical protein
MVTADARRAASGAEPAKLETETDARDNIGKCNNLCVEGKHSSRTAAAW